MQFKPVVRALGMLLVGEAALMLPSLAVSLYYGGEDAYCFLIAIGALLIFGLPAALLVRHKVSGLYAREGFILVGLAWVLLSIFGAIPLLVYPHAVLNPVDAIFESVSGFTTTGASILTDIESLPRGLLFWRSLTHWVGGMGVLVLTIALLPQLGIRSMDILKAEATGPSPGKIMPRIQDTAKVLYGLYLGLSAIMLIVLGFTGMPLYDGLVTVFSTAGTGGYGVLNNSVAGYVNPAAEIVISVFMVLFSVNFALYYAILMGQFRKAFANRELIAFLAIIVGSVLLIAPGIRPLYGTVGESFRHAFFQVAARMSTTGFTTVDYTGWPQYAQMILMALMVIGGCAGSTTGGFKVIRLILAGKAFRRELHLVLHPRIVRSETLDGKPVTEATMRSVLVFFFAYMTLAVLATLIVAVDGFDLATTLTAVLTMLSNAGPGLGLVGPAGNYALFSNFSKIALALCMLLGRLEIMPILLLLMPATWKKL